LSILRDYRTKGVPALQKIKEGASLNIPGFPEKSGGYEAISISLESILSHVNCSKKVRGPEFLLEDVISLGKISLNYEKRSISS